ncbi:MAG TPA: DUF6785 family protein [Armatimonadaceae bacterium]|nr:DUF6785 family protein [Armatimonadaceae bacterium]
MRQRAITVRAVLIGLAAVGLLCAFTPYNNYKVSATNVGGNQFPIASLFLLFLLAGPVNALLRRVAPARAFTRGEMLTVWTLTLVASGIPSSGMMRTFVPNIAAPHYFSDERNEWERKVWGATPEWLKMHDADAARAFFVGYPRGQEHVPWGAWIGPLAAWGLFALFFLGATFCVASILRRQWVENERFAFPLVAVPALLTEEPGAGRTVAPLLRSPLFWVAFGAVTAVHSLRGLHLLYPSIPDLPLQWNLEAMFTSPPGSQIGRFEAAVFFLVVGLSFLLSAEVCFSLWFFFLLYKGEILLCALYNWDMPGSLSGYSWKMFHSLQAFGGAVALVLWTLWAARNHLRDVWEKATGGPRAGQVDDSQEMLGYRAALLGLALCYAGMAAWEWAAGVPVPLIALSLLMVTLAFVVIGWAVCQAGMLFMAMPFATIDVLAPTLGTGPFPLSSLYTLYRAEGSFIYNTREMLLPSVLNGLKGAEVSRTPLRPLLGAMVAALVVGVAVSVWASLSLPYLNGGGNAMTNAWTYRDGPQIPLRFFGNAASVPYPGAPSNLLHVAGGFVGVLGLLVARGLLGTGLHPIGFLAASVHSMHTMWFSLFIGWVAKSVLLRYGGMRGYANALPFFLGLIVGDSVNAVLWMALGYLTGTGYNIMPT